MELATFQRPHLIGIGGIGVSAVARALHAVGKDVRGSDVRESSITRALRAEGIRVVIGQSADNLGDADLVIWSTAIPDTNPERRAAAERGIPLVHRAEALGTLVATRPSIGVVGTHGKGTVASAIARVFDAAGRDPSFLIGGLLNDYGTNARYRPAGPVIAEVDESDGSLVHVHTSWMLINNLEADHLNYYRHGLSDILDRIELALRGNPRLTHVIVNGDDPGALAAAARAEKPAVLFGFDNPAAHYRGLDLALDGACVRFTVARGGERLGTVVVPLPGAYNAGNALAAVAVASEWGLPFEAIQRGLADFHGLENRFTVVPAGPFVVVKDYISHPTGIRRVLQAARGLHPGPITAVFKPYRFTMIHYLQDDYAEAFREAAHTVVTELYPAGEVPIPGIDTPFLCDCIRRSCGRVTYVPAMDDIVATLRRDVAPGGLVIFFGGDDLFAIADEFAAACRPQGDAP